MGRTILTPFYRETGKERLTNWSEVTQPAFVSGILTRSGSYSPLHSIRSLPLQPPPRHTHIRKTGRTAPYFTQGLKRVRLSRAEPGAREAGLVPRLLPFHYTLDDGTSYLFSLENGSKNERKLSWNCEGGAGGADRS